MVNHATFFAVCCRHCKPLERVNVASKRGLCGRSLAVFGEAGGTAVFRKFCKTPAMMNVKNKRYQCAKACRSFGIARNKAVGCKH